MWKELWKALRGTDALAEMVADVDQMLQAGQWMFQQAAQALLRESDWAGMADELYGKDRSINEAEQRVREKILTHLSLGHQADLSACLVLMSVVKDAERIGDYCKNIFEVAKFYQRSFNHPEYFGTLEEVRQAVDGLFGQARTAFAEGKRGQARGVLEEASKARGRCDVIVRQLLGVQDAIGPDEAVAYVLLARCYKRVAAHLANIATSVVSPVPLLDYRGKVKDPDAEE